MPSKLKQVTIQGDRMENGKDMDENSETTKQTQANNNFSNTLQNELNIDLCNQLKIFGVWTKYKDVNINILEDVAFSFIFCFFVFLQEMQTNMRQE